MLLPTGVGEPRQLADDKADHFNVAWLPNSKSFIYSAQEAGHGARTYLMDIQDGKPHPFTPEGKTAFRISPDGKMALARNQNQLWLCPVAGGEPQKVNVSLNSNELVQGFSADGKNLLVLTRGIPLKIDLVNLATGRRQPWKEIAPADLAGAQGIPSIRFSLDGKSYAYSMLRVLSDLYVVDGLK
jgi:Tol biopolymer transport system component